MKETYETGLQGERTAEQYLVFQHGMQCLERRFRAKCGEIDLIMLDGETVVFVEVKTRTTGRKGDGLAAVNPAKQKRIVRAAQFFLLKNNWSHRFVRFDLVELFGDSIDYIPNAFLPYGKYIH